MSQQQSVTVKNAANADVIFAGISGAGQDGTKALWRVDDATLPMDQRITAELSTRWNANRNARVAQFTVLWPFLRDTAVAGVKEKYATGEMRDGRVTIPQNVKSADATDFCVTALNMYASTHVRAHVAAGFAPN